jgi:hypothetical protein
MLRFGGYYAPGIKACAQSINTVMRTYVYRDERPVAQPAQKPQLDLASKQAFKIPSVNRLPRK